MKYNKNGTPKDISEIHVFKDNVLRNISDVYSYIEGKLVLVWTTVKDIISGVFSSGVWMNDESWDNENIWKNEP